MSFNGWNEVRLGDVIVFNPSEKIPKGHIAKKVAMEKLRPFYKFIEGYELAEFKGGSRFRNGDTLLARITPCLENGKTAQVTFLGNGEVGFGSTEFIVMREKPGRTDKDYIYYLAITPQFRSVAVKSMIGTSGRQRVQQDVLENTTILLPSLCEQKAIAAIFSCLDDKIELNNRINKILEEMAQAIFKSWFVDFEPFQDGEFEDSELGRIPKGWRVSNLEEITQQVSVVSKRSDIPSGSRHVGLEHIPRKQLVINESGKIEAVTSNKLRFEKYNVLFGKIRPYFHKVAIAPWDGYCSTDAIVLAPKLDEYYGYMVFTLYSDKFVQFAVKASQGTKMPRAEWNVLKKLLMVIPPVEIALDFNETIAPIILKLIQNIYENSQLSQIRDAILPKLMSGEIRVPIQEVQ